VRGSQPGTYVMQNSVSSGFIPSAIENMCCLGREFHLSIMSAEGNVIGASLADSVFSAAFFQEIAARVRDLRKNVLIRRQSLQSRV